MTRRSYPQIYAVILFFSIFILFEVPVYAHRMLIRPIEPGLIHVVFDNDTAVQGAEVTLYDVDEEQILQGNSDEDGYFDYDRNLPVARVIASDGMGHRATWRPDQEVKAELPKLPVAILTLSVFIFIAVFFQSRQSPKEAKK